MKTFGITIMTYSNEIDICRHNDLIFDKFGISHCTDFEMNEAKNQRKWLHCYFDSKTEYGCAYGNHD